MTDNTETLYNALDKIKELEKENEQMKAQIEKMKSDWADAKKKGLELLNLKTMRIEQLETKIEKMKCCHNCRHCIDKSYCIKPCIKHNKWELAE